MKPLGSIADSVCMHITCMNMWFCFLVNGDCDGPLNCVCMEGWSGDLCTECIPSEGCCKFYYGICVQKVNSLYNKGVLYSAILTIAITKIAQI